MSLGTHLVLGDDLHLANPAEKTPHSGNTFALTVKMKPQGIRVIAFLNGKASSSARTCRYPSERLTKRHPGPYQRPALSISSEAVVSIHGKTRALSVSPATNNCLIKA